MESYTFADAKLLITLKHRLRDVTSLLDASGKVYPNTLEASQVKHEVSVLVSELRVHGLLPADVTLSQHYAQHHDDEPEQEEGRTKVTTFDPTRYQEQMPLDVALSELRRLGYRECSEEEAHLLHGGGGASPLYVFQGPAGDEVHPCASVTEVYALLDSAYGTKERSAR
jgi:hypothetical protein